MGLILDAGTSSVAGKRKQNEDVCLALTPSSERHLAYGGTFIVADGVGGLPNARAAAETAVHAFRDCYYAAPETWGLERALQECLRVANGAVVVAAAGGASTLSALILRHRRYGIGHVGDSRVWLYRQNRLKQLTRDHSVAHRDIGTMVTRACGLDETVSADVSVGELSVGDVFLLTSDGVHATLNGGAIARCLEEATGAQALVDALTARALAAGSLDNISACAVRVLALPEDSETHFSDAAASLPIRSLPKIGATLDGFRIDGLVHQGRMSSLYKAHDSVSNEAVALKFPNPQCADDPQFVEAFLREEWLGRRIESPYLVKGIPIAPGRRSQLYTALAFHDGDTLAARIARKHGLNPREAMGLTQQLLTALDHLHRKGVLHRDVKPENILLAAENRLLLIDLGVSRIEHMRSREQASAPVGTPSYMAPELFDGAAASEGSDVYSAGVTLYEMLTQRFPYGEIEAFSHPRFNRYVSPERFNPDVPAWLAEVVRKACAADPRARFSNVVDFHAALNESTAAASIPNLRVPLLERIPPQRWRALFWLSAGANAFFIFWLLTH